MNRAIPLVLLLGCVEARPVAEVESVEGAVEVTDVAVNPGRLRFFVMKPPGLTAPRGLVVALHGCAQRAADFQQTGLDRLAQEHDFIVLYPQTSASTGCFRWFDPHDVTRGEGELASLEAAVLLVTQREHVPAGAVFVTGLSAGGAMTAAALAAMPDVFSAGAVFAGVPAGCAKTMSEGLRCQAGVDEAPAFWARAVTPSTRRPRVQVWTGDVDTTVSPSMAGELVEQWTAGLQTSARVETAGRLTSTQHLVDGGVVVQQVVVQGMGHAVPVAPAQRCGRAAPFISDVNVCAMREAVRFFGLIDDEVEVLPVFDGGVDAGALISDAGVVDAGVLISDGGVCTSAVTTPWLHLLAGRGVQCGFWGTLVCGRGTGELLGAAASVLPVVASSVDGQAWSAAPCP
jgi:poly(hydroxyalkanoate) depolymerase family esterase